MTRIEPTAPELSRDAIESAQISVISIGLWMRMAYGQAQVSPSLGPSSRRCSFRRHQWGGYQRTIWSSSLGCMALPLPSGRCLVPQGGGLECVRGGID